MIWGDLHICFAIASDSSILIGPRAMRSANVSPSTVPKPEIASLQTWTDRKLPRCWGDSASKILRPRAEIVKRVRRPTRGVDRSAVTFFKSDCRALDSAMETVLLSYDRVMIQLNFKSGKPVYLQVVDQIKAAAASGALRTGEALPCIRPLAEDLRVNRNTVAKAYAELESLGVIETVPGKGCFLKESQSPLRKEVRRRMLIEEIDQAIVQAHHLVVSDDEFLDLVRQRMAALEDKRRANEKKED